MMLLEKKKCLTVGQPQLEYWNLILCDQANRSLMHITWEQAVALKKTLNKAADHKFDVMKEVRQKVKSAVQYNLTQNISQPWETIRHIKTCAVYMDKKIKIPSGHVIQRAYSVNSMIFWCATLAAYWLTTNKGMFKCKTGGCI